MLDPTKLWNELPIVVIDFETTGPDPKVAAPVEVGAARFEGGRVVAEWSSLVNPGCPIPEAATAIHGITDAMVAEAPPLMLLSPKLYELARDAVPVGYNAPYDRTVLHRYITGPDCPLFAPSQEWIDVYVIVASGRVDKYVSGTGRLKLDAACKRWGIDLDGAHRALADAKATGQLLFRLLEKEAVKSCQLGKLLEHTTKQRGEHEADHARWRKQLREQERIVWRQYAAAALTCAGVDCACEVADAMLEQEQKRFGEGGRS
jgi:DNA polymerase III epsilon subunit-like protein